MLQELDDFRNSQKVLFKEPEDSTSLNVTSIANEGDLASLNIYLDVILKQFLGT